MARIGMVIDVDESLIYINAHVHLDDNHEDYIEQCNPIEESYSSALHANYHNCKRVCLVHDRR